MSAPTGSRVSISSVLSHFLNLAAAFAAIFAAAYLIPRFGAMFVDLLGGQPLPPITQLVLENRMLWIGLGCVLASASLSMAWLYRFRSAPPLFSVGLLLLAAAQVGLIIFALLLPLGGTIIRQSS